MTLTSFDDLWAYISSVGGIAAGRQNPDNSLFPYYTDDKLHEQTSTGLHTKISVTNANGNNYIWEPFSRIKKHKIQRNLYRSPLGNKIVFEEINKELNISYQYLMQGSGKYGFIFKSKLSNLSNESLKFTVINGIQDISPFGISVGNQESMSNLINAYKYGEILNNSKIGVFSLTTLISDKPEPVEAMYANIVWGSSNFDHTASLSIDKEINNIYGQKLNYYIKFDKKITSNESIDWSLNADVKKNQDQILMLENEILNKKSIINEIKQNLDYSSKKLTEYVQFSDGFQLTNNRSNDFRHTSNVLYNIMRGGVFINGYEIKISQFLDFLKKRNKIAFSEFKEISIELNNRLSLDEILKLCNNSKNNDLKRLGYEFLPLVFSRRHGDPSRPWNYFNIKVSNKKDDTLINYEGNWRDIFQNWEALSISYPKYTNSFIAKFLNATTVDGFNPYRMNQDGIDWEIIEKDDNWTHIGYWNDHQIIYLLKLLELSYNNSNDELLDMLNRKIFSFANVPYRIKSFDQIMKNPKSTIDFDHELNSKIMKLVDTLGQDGKLVIKNDSVIHVSMIEKLFILILPKITFLVPGGGIWLNTQRPEWNDANNATVGNGLSMVTTCYLRKYVNFIKLLVERSILNNFQMFEALQIAIKNINKYLLEYHQDKISKYELLNKMGTNYSNYCSSVYNKNFNTSEISKNDLLKNLDLIFSLINSTIDNNKRDDYFYHSYNILEHNKNKTDISHQKLMLEGQVAVLTSNKLNLKQSVNLISNLYKSTLFRPDQNSFILYPNKVDFSFLQRNQIPKKYNDYISKNKFKGVFVKDVNSNYRFNSSIRNEFELKSYLDRQPIIDKDNVKNILNIYDKTFNHKRYMGRSESMFGYEGINSIYWHMVSKLLLAIQESYLRFYKNENPSLLKDLGKLYYKVRQGLSWEKTADEYGAFPFDAYSHTPYHGIPQQPGMTGQVKEDILVRFGEFGCFIKNGSLSFMPYLLRKDEFNKNSKIFNYFDLDNNEKTITVKYNELAFTYCQVPIIYKLSIKEKQSIKVHYKYKECEEFNLNQLSIDDTNSITFRLNKINKIEYHLPESIIFN